MGLDYSLEVVFDNQSDEADVLFKNATLFLLNSKMDILFLALASFISIISFPAFRQKKSTTAFSQNTRRISFSFKFQCNDASVETKQTY